MRQLPPFRPFYSTVKDHTELAFAVVKRNEQIHRPREPYASIALFYLFSCTGCLMHIMLGRTEDGPNIYVLRPIRRHGQKGGRSRPARKHDLPHSLHDGFHPPPRDHPTILSSWHDNDDDDDDELIFNPWCASRIRRISPRCSRDRSCTPSSSPPPSTPPSA